MVKIDEIFLIYASSRKRTLKRHLLSTREGVLTYRHQSTCLVQDLLGVLKTKYYVTHWHYFVTLKLIISEALSRPNIKQSFTRYKQVKHV
jgi:hypothetical protein